MTTNNNDTPTPQPAPQPAPQPTPQSTPQSTPQPTPPTTSQPTSQPASPDVKEEVFFEGRVPLKAALGKHRLWYVLLLGWNIGLLIAWLSSLMMSLRVTSQRVVIIRGLISQREEDIPLYRATDIHFIQTVAGRLFGTGTITLYSDDKTAPHVTFAVKRPRELKEKIRESMNKERIRFRSRSID